MTKAYSYIRFSSKSQASGDSLRRQTRLAEDYANKLGLELDFNTYQDLGVSAWTGSNTSEDAALGQFILACEKNQIPRGSHLLVESLDRLSREDVESAMHQLMTLTKIHGIVVVTLSDNKVYKSPVNMIDLIMSLTIMQRSNEESEIKSQRLRAVHEHKRANPETSIKTERCPFWLELTEDRKGYQVIEEQAAIVASIFESSIAGIGIHRILQDLNNRNIKPPKADHWGTSTIGAILTNKAVFGCHQPHHYVEGVRKPVGEVKNNYFPVIVSEDEYYLSASKRKARDLTNKSTGRRGKYFTNLFNSIAKCASCGSSMLFNKKNKKHSYLTCRGRIMKLCDNKPVRYDKMELLITERFLSPLFINHLAEYSNRKNEKVDNSTTLEILESKLQNHNDKIQSYIDANDGINNERLIVAIRAENQIVNNIILEIESFKISNAKEQIKSENAHLDLKMSCQLVSNCLQSDVNGTKNESLSDMEIFRERAKLNKILLSAFGEVKVFNSIELGLSVRLNTGNATFDKYWFNNNSSTMKWYLGLNMTKNN